MVRIPDQVTDLPRMMRILMLTGGGISNRSGGVGTMMSALRDALPNVSFQIIDTRGPGGVLNGIAYFPGALLRFATARNIDVVHLHMTTRGSMVRKCLLLALCRALHRPTIVHMHGADFFDHAATLPRWWLPFLRRSLRSAQTIVVLGESWRQSLIDHLGLDPSRVAVIRNGVPAPTPRTPRQDGPTQILFLGRLGDRKGTPDLLAALSSKPLADRPWRATLAGDGDIPRFTQIAKAAGLADRIAIPDWVTSTEAANLMAQADILVLPSHHEALPMAVVEALAHSVAVITTPVGVLPELLTNGQNALLIPPGDIQALTQALTHLIDDPTHRQRLATAGHAVFRTHLDVSVTANAMFRLYESAAKTNRSGH